jgi:hypothetical protein
VAIRQDEIMHFSLLVVGENFEEQVKKHFRQFTLTRSRYFRFFPVRGNNGEIVGSPVAIKSKIDRVEMERIAKDSFVSAFHVAKSVGPAAIKFFDVREETAEEYANRKFIMPYANAILDRGRVLMRPSNQSEEQERAWSKDFWGYVDALPEEAVLIIVDVKT